MLIPRIVTALVLAAVFLGALFFLPAAGWVLFCAGVLGVASWEWCQLAGISGWSAKFYPALTGVLFAALGFADLPALLLFGVFLLATLLWCVVVPLWLMHKWRLQLAGNFNVLLGWAFLFPAGLALLLLRGDGWQLLAVLAVAWLADSFAYFSGVLFGKHKLAPSISPGKSWEGAAGGLLAVMLYCWFLPKPPMFFSDTQPLLQAFFWILTGFLLVAVSIVGDLLESLFKRQAGIKDSSNLLPGHGGVLDRIDSLLALLPVAAAIQLAHQLFWVVPVHG